MTASVRGRVVLTLFVVLAGIAGPVVAAAGARAARPAQPTVNEYVKYYVVGTRHQARPESLDEVAGWFLHAPGRATDIYHLNAGRRQPDGGALAVDRALRPGWLLVLPWDAVGDGVRYGILPTTASPVPAGAGTPSAADPPASPNADPVPRTSSPARELPGPPPITRPASRADRSCATTEPARPRSDWVRRQMAVEQVWERTRGEGVLVAVVDSGVDATVPQLAGRVTPGVNIPAGTGRGDTDCLGSGTAMASILAARSRPGDPAGVVGIAPATTILPIRVVTEIPRASVAASATAIEAAIAAGAKVVAVGAYVDLTDPALADALARAAEHDVVVVAAAPLDSSSPPVPPAAADVLWVGGVGPEGQLVANYRAGLVDVTAPAVDVPSLSAVDHAVRSSSGSQYGVAAVAGLVALVRSAYPHLAATQVRRRVEISAEGAGAAPDPARGAGMINPSAALTLVLAEEITPATPATTEGPSAALLAAVGLTVLVGVAAVTVLLRRRTDPGGRRAGARDPDSAGTDRGLVTPPCRPDRTSPAPTALGADCGGDLARPAGGRRADGGRPHGSDGSAPGGHDVRTATDLAR
ncbi:S8 family serine peptidase [Micromonospora marina]|uniref:S8 family serine peptidase n=1 Tax=Micromonospora marina TaxID=307120 RepID=UPI003454C234